MLKRRTLAVIVALMGVSWSALPGLALSQVVFQFTATDHGRTPAVQPGDVRTIATYDVSAELVGLSCSVSVTSTNDESVHINNFVRITSNGDSLDVLGTEDGVNGVHTTSKTLELGSTIVVTNHIGRRALGELPVGTSVQLTIGVTCTTSDDTTTTSTSTPSSSSTTAPETSSTSGATSTSTSTASTLPPVTSSTVPTDSTTTTNPPPSTIPPGTSTSTTVPPTESTEPPTSTPPTLPDTGPADVAGLAMAGVALLLLGGGVLVAGREGR